MPHPITASNEPVEISRLALRSSAPPEASISDVKHLTSYNWIEAPSPTISVPGCPAQWSPLKGPRQIKKDAGLVYHTQNVARHPDSPLEPLFRALYIEHPSFDISSIDVVTDRNALWKLLAFIKPTLTHIGLDAFTINVDLTAQTALFSREGTAAQEVIDPTQFRGFSHEFEKAYTTSQINNSTGHHQVISYRLGGLSFLVRHKTNAYMSSNRGIETRSDYNPANNQPLSPKSPSDDPAIQSKLTIKKEGRVIPPESTIEIRTRASHKPIQLKEVAPTLWLSQIPNMVRAHHKRGRFSNPRVENVAGAVKEWEQSHQEDTRRFVGVINRIIRVTRDWGGCSTVRYRPEKDKLVISKAEGRKKMLPGDLYARWPGAETFPGVSRRSFSSMTRVSSRRNLMFGGILQTLPRRLPLQVIPL